MKRTTKYVAFDVHQATTDASVRDDSGRVLARSALETHGPSIVEFLRGMRGALHVAFEVGIQSQWLHDLVARATQSLPARSVPRRKAAFLYPQSIQLQSDLNSLGFLCLAQHRQPPTSNRHAIPVVRPAVNGLVV